jgi:phosphate-selective porin OprO/OprP
MRRTIALGAVVLALGAPAGAQIQSPLAPPPAPAARSDDVPKAVQLVWRDHPSVRAGSQLRLDFQAKFQWDARRPGDDPIGFDRYEIHRARVGIQGEVFRHFQFEIERELTERENFDRDNTDRLTPPKSAWKDVFLEVNYTDKAQVRLGKFKIPFGLDQHTSVANNDFVHRSLGASYLSPARDLGLMVHGRFFGRDLNYDVGVFKQDGENSRSTKVQGGDETVAARVVGRPFTTRVARLDRAEVGGAVVVSAVSAQSVLPNGLRGRTVMSQYTYFEPVFVNGRRRRFGGEFDWMTGPFGVRAEFIQVGEDRKGQGFGDEDLPDARARAWYVSGAWVVTGEDKERPPTPRRRLGAVEIAARYERLWFDSVDPEPDAAFSNPRAYTILPSGDRVLTLGVNWYLNRWVKLQLDAIREHPLDAERNPLLRDAAFWSPVFRLQLGL